MTATDSPHSQVGIEKIWAYPCSLSVDLLEVASVRGRPPQEVRDDLLVLTRSINPLWEDPVTMALNAAKPMLTEEDKKDIELVIVGTESSTDQSKAMSTYAHKFLGLDPNCRNYESKHACYSGTVAVMMAAHWVASGAAPGKKALVICTDQSRESLNEHYEYVMGAGAVAMLISNNPRVLRFADLRQHGYFTCDALDTFRPTSRVETGNNEISLYSYLDALESAYQHYLSKAGELDFDEYFQWHIYHVPFGGMAFQAHRTALRFWKRMKKSEAMAHFERKVKPSLLYNMYLGGTYAASTFLALMGLVDSEDVKPGDRVSMFSYGSGSGGEFYPAVIGPDAKELIGACKLKEQIDNRRVLTLEEYETLERKRHELIDNGDWSPDTSELGDLYEKRYAGQGMLVLKSIEDHFREYGWS